MPREIITRNSLPQSGQAIALSATEPTKPDEWTTQLLKMLPAEVVGAYVTLSGILTGSMLPTNTKQIIHWSIFAVLFVLNPLYLYFVSKQPNRLQIGLATIAFVIWVMSLGGPFVQFFDETLIRLLGSILVPIFTLASLIIINAANKPQP